MTDSSRILEAAVRAGRLAAEVCLRVQAEDVIAGLDKSDKSPVTVADFASQALILREIAASFPEHAIIAEEDSAQLEGGVAERVRELVAGALGEPVTLEQVFAWIDHKGDARSPYRWAIDPIDGTKGFLRRAQYAIAIGLLRDSIPYAGVLVCPSLAVDPSEAKGEMGTVFAACAGEGATQESLSGAGKRTIHVNQSTDRSKIRVLGSVESSHGDPKVLTDVVEQLNLGGGIVRVDSQVKYAVLARGEAEIYLRPQSKPDWRENIWDHAAGVLVAAEAGARSTDMNGKDLDFSRGPRLEENRGVVTTNGKIHDDVIRALSKVAAN